VRDDKPTAVARSFDLVLLTVPDDMLADVGAHGPEPALAAALDSLRPVRGLDLDYLELAGPDLGPVPETGEARVLIAARVGSTRLIDNMPVRLGGDTAA